MTKLDEMLSQWPMREPTQLEVDEAAERVTGAIAAGQLPASVDESLFAPPLPKTADEGQTSAPRQSKPGFAAPGIAVENKMSKDRTRDRTSFQELAKLATTTPPPPTSSAVPSAPTSSGQSGVLRAKEAESSDSGIVDLKMIAQLDPTAEQRAKSTPLASDGLFDDESAPPKPAVTAAVAEQAMAASAAPAAAPAVAQPTASASVAPKKAAPATQEKKGGGGVVLAIGALVAAAAIAAGGFFFVKYQRAHQAAVATQTSTPAADKVAANDKPAAKTQATATAAASVAQNDTQAQDIQEMPDPNAQGGSSKPILKFHGKQSAGGGGGGGAAPQESAAAPAGTVDPKLIANVPTGGAGGGSGDLAEAMKAAAGGGTGLGQGAQNADQGPKFAAGSVPQRPSQGQVAGAIGSVMPAAKACLGADDPMSRATITFQSDGTVKSVSVTGFAAGKPQEACIKTALSKAKVDPFAEATYPVPVSIRSN